ASLAKTSDGGGRAEASISRPGRARHFVSAGLRWFRVDFAAVPLAWAAFQTPPRLGIRLASLAKTSDGGGIDIEALDFAAVPLAWAAFHNPPRLCIRLASLAKTSDGGGIDIEARKGSAFGFGGATLP
ncbi:hypothetical protein THAOC_25520, partial [Thalassiosira oceanica]